jgi:two-component system sensor histidine kinase UhpB
VDRKWGEHPIWGSDPIHARRVGGILNGMRTVAARWRALPLFWQIFAPNAAVLIAATLVLAFSSATVSDPIVSREALVVGAGLLLLLAVNFLVIRRALKPVEELTEVMQEVDLLVPGHRVSLSTRSSEIDELRAVFNRMLERLETERRQMGRRTLLAQEEERRRLARELHDELNQSIAGVMLSLRGIAADSDGEVGAQLRGAQEELRSVSADVETIVNRLRPETLDDLGLLSALVVLGEQFAQRSGIKLERRFANGLPELDPEAELVVYRVAQESLTNVVVHADAARVVMEVAPEGKDVRLTIRDDGVGLNGGREGNGIRGMRERALLVRATLAIGPNPDGPGTQVELTVPARAKR